jgi:diguanylate cyclase (GGDEF)-like protein
MMKFLNAIKSKGQIGRLIWPISLVMVAVAGLLVVLTLYLGRSMDQQAVGQQRALVDNALTIRLNRNIDELRSVAWWDDAVNFSSKNGFNKGWLDQEIGSYVDVAYHHDRLIILDEGDQPVYTFGETSGTGTAQLASDLAATRAIIAQARGGPNASPRVETRAKKGELYETAPGTTRRYSRGFGGIVSVNGKPALAQALLISPSNDLGKVQPKRRIILSIVDLTPIALRQLGKDIMLSDLGFHAKNSAQRALFAVKTDQGQMLASLAWTPKQPGTDMMRQVLPMILGALAVAAGMMGFLMLRLFRSTARLAEREAQAQHLANHDALTGLPNRRKFERELFRRSGAAQKDQLRLACAVLDLDRFKDVNDTLGHGAGDNLISLVGARLTANLAPTDFVARLGGDEFAILRSCYDLHDAENLARAISAAFAEPFPVMGHELESCASVGISVSSLGRAVEDLLREADIALYEAKAKQKGSTVRFAPAMANKIEQRRALEIDLKMAIANAGLTMAYQPIVDAASGAISSVEALVRWNCPKHGSVPPDVFVAIAEETGMMADLGRFVIEQSVADSKRWPHIKTAINISPAQLRSASIVNDLMRPLRENGVSPLQITLEITESVLLSNDQRTLRTLNILKDNGFALALDDFGTGYSSLAYVRDFPFDKLKIDRSFVQGQVDSGRSLDIVKAVVNFGRILGREVVAEGIETKQEMQAMQAAGVTHLQGFLFSRPISAAHIEALIATSSRLTASEDSAPETEGAIAISRDNGQHLRRIA